jgi:hypothetical protein
MANHFIMVLMVNLILKNSLWQAKKGINTLFAFNVEPTGSIDEETEFFFSIFCY